MGNAIQAGTPPEPDFLGYEADTVGSAGTRNYQGVFATQTIKTAGRGGALARYRSLNMDLMNAELAVRRTRIDLLSRVKAAYYAVLVVQQNVAITSAMAWFTNEAYRIQVDKLRAGEATAYEPAQLRSLAVQARAAQIQAQNQYITSWKQLTALIGLPDMPTAELEGRADMPAPVVNYEAMLNRVLNFHPEVLAARNLETKARLQLQLDRVLPIPDVQMYGTFQRDFTTPASGSALHDLRNIAIRIAGPAVRSQSRQHIIVAPKATCVGQPSRCRRTRNDLTRLGRRMRFNRLRNQLAICVQSYRDQILPDLGRLAPYRGSVYPNGTNRNRKLQVLAISSLPNRIWPLGWPSISGRLNDQWAAVADIANLMQARI